MSTGILRSHKSGQIQREGNVLVGCLVVLGVVLLAAVIGGVVVYKNWKTWAADFGRDAIVTLVEEADLEKDQKDAIIARVDELAEDFKAGVIDLEDMGNVTMALVESPLLPLGAVMLAHHRYIEPSELSDEEKAAGQLALQRYARGIYEETIALEDIEDVMSPISDQDLEGNMELRDPDQVTTEDLREFISLVKARADEAQIPDEPFELDIAAEVNKAIDIALGIEPQIIEAAPDGETPVDEPEPPVAEDAQEPVEDEGGGG